MGVVSVFVAEMAAGSQDHRNTAAVMWSAALVLGVMGFWVLCG